MSTLNDLDDFISNVSSVQEALLEHLGMEIKYDYAGNLFKNIKITRKGEDKMEKTLHNSDISGAHKNVPDIKVVGNGDMFQLLCKASSQAEGWMKSTKAMEVPGGCVVQVTTHQRNHDGTNAVAEALTFVPGVQIVKDDNNGRKLVEMVIYGT